MVNKDILIVTLACYVCYAHSLIRDTTYVWCGNSFLATSCSIAYSAPCISMQMQLQYSPRGEVSAFLDDNNWIVVGCPHNCIGKQQLF